MADSLGRSLTHRQREIFEYVAGEVATRGYPPTHRDVMSVFGFGSTNAAACHFTALRKKGYLTCQGRTARGISLTGLGRAYAAERGYDVGGGGAGLAADRHRPARRHRGLCRRAGRERRMVLLARPLVS